MFTVMVPMQHGYFHFSSNSVAILNYSSVEVGVRGGSAIFIYIWRQVYTHQSMNNMIYTCSNVCRLNSVSWYRFGHRRITTIKVLLHCTGYLYVSSTTLFHFWSFHHSIFLSRWFQTFLIGLKSGIFLILSLLTSLRMWWRAAQPLPACQTTNWSS